MKKVAVVLSVVLASTMCMGQEVYHNDEWHFTFPLSYEWQEVTADEIEGKYSKMVYETLLEPVSVFWLFDSLDDEEGEQSRRAEDVLKSDQTLAILQKEGSFEGQTAFMIVMAQEIGNPHDTFTAEHHYQQAIRGDGYRGVCRDRLKDLQKMIQEAGPEEGWKPDSYYGSYGYLEAIRCYIEQAGLTGKNGQALVFGRIQLLGGNRVTTIVYHAYNEDCRAFIDTMAELRRNFKYDKNYGYGEAPPSTQLKTFWVWATPSLGGLLVMGIFCAAIHWWINK